jgi:hypothetical protein
MLGKKFPEEAKEKVGKANSYPVVCEGKEFSSIKEAEEYYKSLGVEIPEGLPGCNPGGISTSKKIKIIGELN